LNSGFTASRKYPDLTPADPFDLSLFPFLFSGHGIDTTDGRSYDDMVLDGLVDVGHRLNNLKARGIL